MLQSIGTKQLPAFIVGNAIDGIQIETVKTIFHFDKPLDAIGLHFAGTDLGPLFIEYEGTPLIKSFSLYGTLMKSIIHQQLNLSFSHILTKRFVESFGEMVDGVWSYPSPENIALLDVVALWDLGRLKVFLCLGSDVRIYFLLWILVCKTHRKMYGIWIASQRKMKCLSVFRSGHRT